MRTGNVEETELAKTSMIDEIRRTAEHRLQEIEPLIAEAERLRDVLSVIEQGPQPPQPGHARRRRQLLGPSLGLNGHGAMHASRTPKGANKRIILELVAQRPGITTAEIAQITGVKRTVVASTVSRLKRRGELQAHAAGVRIPTS